MIETAMIFALGFFTATFFTVVAVPAINARAERLARRRVQAQLPLSLDEIAAERDHLRAEFAVSARQLERRNEALLSDKTEALSEVGRQQIALKGLTEELSTTKASLTQVRGEAADLAGELATTRDRLARTEADLDDTRKSLSVREAAAERLEADNHQARNTLESQRVVIAEFEAKVASLEGNLASDAQVFAKLTRELAVQKEANAELERARAADRRAAAALAERIASLERLRDDQSERIAGLEKAERELARRLTDSSVAASRQTEALKANAGRLAWLSRELETLKASMKTNAETARASVRSATDDVEMLRAEKSSLEGALEQARDDRLKLQRELTQLKRELAGRIAVGAGRRPDGADGADAVNGDADEGAPTDPAGATGGVAELGALRSDRAKLQREVARLKRDLSAGRTEIEASNAALRQRIEQVADAIMRRPPAKPDPASLARPKSGRARS